MTSAPAEILWEASSTELEASFLWAFKKHVEDQYSLQFQKYSELHAWSVNRSLEFWREFLTWSGIKFSGIMDPVYVPKSGKFYGGQWFPNLRLNYAQNLLQNLPEIPLRSFYEGGERIGELNKSELLSALRFFQKEFQKLGVQKGTRVAAFVGNNHLAIIAMLAATSLGATWSSCSPDFGEQGVLDRFHQVQPALYLYSHRSLYNGKEYLLEAKNNKIIESLTAKFPAMQSAALEELFNRFAQKAPAETQLSDLHFEEVGFADPLYILFSSGTTGVPKCIVHSVGGTLLQHVKEHLLHGNLKKNERFFYYTTTGWMMWNWMVSALFAGCEIYTLEGAPMTADWNLWDFVDKNKIRALGTSAKFIAACRQRHLAPRITSPRITFSTGSPLLPEDFDYYYSTIDPAGQSQLASISGGTDIVSCFMLGNIWSPVRRGEIQGAGLGMDIAAFSEGGESLRGQEGELVCQKPFPAMPTGFLNDPDDKKFAEAYFSRFKNVWHHGDYVTLTSAGGVVVHGRSDTTLNPGGVRIGTAEIYRVVEQDAAVADSLVVGKTTDGDEKIILFLKLKNSNLTTEISERIKRALRAQISPRHVPDAIFQVSDIPYTLSGKKVELAVKKILKGEEPKNTEALQNPGVLSEYMQIAKQL